MTKGRKQIVMNKTSNVDQISQIYKGMNETGKKKLADISEQFLKIWNTVHEKEIPPVDENIKIKNE
jgi:hypothetical protein